MTDGPLKHATESGLNIGNLEGVVKQEFITYRVRDGMLVKETVKRRYFGDDYHDASTTEPLMKVV
jgi:hypothetical protein|tara:strand:+ start:133 stop:327 length:195 start_codon:yes stop_codon:yes gene_type:complete